MVKFITKLLQCYCTIQFLTNKIKFVVRRPCFKLTTEEYVGVRIFCLKILGFNNDVESSKDLLLGLFEGKLSLGTEETANSAGEANMLLW